MGLRQINPKATPFPRFGFQPDAAAHPFNGFLDDGRPIPVPGYFSPPCQSRQEALIMGWPL